MGKTMNTEVERILNQALGLRAQERVLVVERLLGSLEPPDPASDATWAQEVEARIAAYDRGEIDSVPADQVFGKYEDR